MPELKRVFLTGMSGTGKSTVIATLAERGDKAIDLDEPGWSVYDAWGEWVWREDCVRELFGVEDADVLFVSGCPENQVSFYPQFDHIILLSAPAETIMGRLRTRTNNSYAKEPEEQAEVLGYLDTVEPRLRRVASHEIDATQSLEDVVASVIAIAEQ
jgi:dephospho-CoA kinase